MTSGIETASLDGSASTRAATPLDFLSAHPLFETLPVALRAQLAGRLERHELASGVELPRRADGPIGLFLIESGQIARVVRGTRSPVRQVVATLGRFESV